VDLEKLKGIDMNKVRAIKVTLKDILDGEAVNAVAREWIIPKKATILSNNAGTLVEAEEGGLFLVTVGDWFRSSFFGKGISQVDDFEKLRTMGFTAIKDALPEIFTQKEIKSLEKSSGQEIRGKDNGGAKKADKAVASDNRSQKKD
jgi:hypothetical protein